MTDSPSTADRICSGIGLAVLGSALSAGGNAAINAVGAVVLRELGADENTFDLDVKKAALAGAIGGAILGGAGGLLEGSLRMKTEGVIYALINALPVASIIGAAIEGNYAILDSFVGELTGEAMLFASSTAIVCMVALAADD